MNSLILPYPTSHPTSLHHEILLFSNGRKSSRFFIAFSIFTRFENTFVLFFNVRCWIMKKLSISISPTHRIYNPTKLCVYMWPLLFLSTSTLEIFCRVHSQNEQKITKFPKRRKFLHLMNAFFHISNAPTPSVVSSN